MRITQEICVNPIDSQIQTLQTFVDSRPKQYLRLSSKEGGFMLSTTSQKPGFFGDKLKTITTYLLSFADNLKGIDENQANTLYNVAFEISKKIDRYNSKWYRRIFTFLKIDRNAFSNTFGAKIQQAVAQKALQKNELEIEKLKGSKPNLRKLSKENLSDMGPEKLKALQEVFNRQISSPKKAQDGFQELVGVKLEYLAQIEALMNFCIHDSAKQAIPETGKQYVVVRQDGDGNCLFHTFSYGIRVRMLEDPRMKARLQKRFQNLEKEGIDILKNRKAYLMPPEKTGIYTTQQLREIAHDYLQSILKKGDNDLDKPKVNELLDNAIADQNAGPQREIREALRNCCVDIIQALETGPKKKYTALFDEGKKLQTPVNGKAWAKGDDKSVQEFIEKAFRTLEKDESIGETIKDLKRNMETFIREERRKVLAPEDYQGYLTKMQRNGYYASFPEIYALSRVFGLNVNITQNADTYNPQPYPGVAENFPPLESVTSEVPVELDFENVHHFNYILAKLLQK